MRRSASISNPDLQIVDRNSSAQDQLTSFGQLRLRAQELSIVGLPIYNAKRKLVEKVMLKFYLSFNLENFI